MTAHRVFGIVLWSLLVSIAFPALAAEPEAVVEDRERIQAHLLEVETELRERDVSHLSQKLQAQRQRNLDILREYREAGEFPHNTHVPWRHPVFIDREDRFCAVGYLMKRSGWEKEARQISARENLSYLLEMESPEVEDWVAQSGLSADEAAWIQPGYSPCMDCSCDPSPVCGDDGNTYLNECVIDTCTDVQIAYRGCCELGDEPNHDVPDGFYVCGYPGDDSYEDLCADEQDVGDPDAGYTAPDVGHTEADAGHTAPDTGHTEPDAGTIAPDTGHTEPDAGHTASDTGHTDPDAGQTDAQWEINEDDAIGPSSGGSDSESTCAAVVTTPTGGLVLVAITLLGLAILRRR